MPDHVTTSDARGRRADAPAAGACLAALLLAACGGASDSAELAPVPRSIDPPAGFAGLTTAVRISGDRFLARPTGGDRVDTHHRAWLGDVELADVTWLDPHTLSATAPAALTPGQKTLKVENAYGLSGALTDAFTALAPPATLAASITASRFSVGLGQPIAVTFTVTNGGTGVALLATVSPSQSGVAAPCGAVAPATPLTLAAGKSQRFTWWCTGVAAGVVLFSGAVAGTDTTTGVPVGAAPAVAARVAIQAPPALVAAVSVDGNPASVVIGEALTLRLVISNQGGAAAVVTALTVTPAEAGCGAPTPATPQTVTSGVPGIPFTFTCAATTAPLLAPAIAVLGQDANDDAPVTASATLAPGLAVHAAAALTATVGTAPTVLGVGQASTVTFYVTNGAGAPRATLTGVAPSITGTGGATCGAVTVPRGTAIAAGGNRHFGWTCTATRAGDLLVGGTLRYTAGGVALTASPAVPVAVTVSP